MGACVIFTSSGVPILVDEQDYPELSRHRWCLDGKGYPTRNAVVNGKHRMLLMHREILKPPPDMAVDHANGRKTDNRRGNIRICTLRQNNANRHVITGTSRYIGVRKKTDHGRVKRWQSRIRGEGGVEIHLGYFATEAEAALAYDRAALKIHKQFASLNFNRQEAA